jgi:hypothetical protein
MQAKERSGNKIQTKLRNAAIILDNVYRHECFSNTTFLKLNLLEVNRKKVS